MKFPIILLAAAISTPLLAQTQPPQPAQPAPHGKVLFSRSIDENGNTATTEPAAATQPTKPTATDAERQALHITAMRLDVRLRPANSGIAVRAELTVQNTGHTPLQHIPLQISSQLNWEHLRLGNQDEAFTVATLNSDSDHTGQLHEASLTPATPLAPGSTAQIDALYSGSIEQSSQRLLSIGTPAQAANASDWDRISLAFTGLRGFGNVVWYPVSTLPVVLGDGARLFDEIGQHKLSLTGTHFALTLTVEAPAAQLPNIALLNGQPAELKTATTGAADSVNGPAISGILTASLADTTLGFEAPSIFLAQRTDHPGSNIHVQTISGNDASTSVWLHAAETVTPFLSDWLGKTPRTALTVLELPESNDTPFETASLLVTPVKDADPEVLSGIMAHALAHAWFPHTESEAPTAWLNEGVAHFIGTLWLEHQHGRERALGTLEAARTSLAISEPSSPGSGDGQPLTSAWSPSYYRTKAAYVFWMLRDIAGDDALQRAFSSFDPAADISNEAFEHVLEKSGQRQDLSWFFNDWVYADKGLPDIAIESVYSSNVSVPGSKLVAVNLANNGYAAAEIPVTVRTDQTSITERIEIPARSKVVKRILIQGKPYEVQANDGTIPEIQASVHIHKLEDTPAAP